ncbi:protein kinase [Oscillospiraceae bacterium HV4-5-C5C]|nr:protein kinase [Oscillospiraceae bacterium HV4-5-C5C]
MDQMEARARLSYYEILTPLNQAHQVKLVRQRETGLVYVMKTLNIYCREVYDWLLTHPNPGRPRLIELIEDQAVLYVIEEYICGLTLRQRLQAEGRFSAEAAWQIMMDLCKIMAPLHALDPPLVHRDLKPENILFRLDGSLVLIDFNSARLQEAGRVQDTTLLGTQGYAAPEQYGFAASAATADIFAAGVLLDEMLTGSRHGSSSGPGRKGDWLDKISRRCREMDPQKRYKNARDLGRALSAAGLLQFPAGRLQLLRRAGTGRFSPGLPGVKRDHGWQNRLPGFRGHNPLVHALAGLWYGVVIAGSLTAEVESGSVWGARAGLLLVLGGCSLLWGNFRQIWARLPLLKSSDRRIRLAGLVCWTLVLFMLSGALMNL